MTLEMTDGTAHVHNKRALASKRAFFSIMTCFTPTDGKDIKKRRKKKELEGERVQGLFTIWSGISSFSAQRESDTLHQQRQFRPAGSCFVLSHLWNTSTWWYSTQVHPRGESENQDQLFLGVRGRVIASHTLQSERRKKRITSAS